MRSFRYIAVSVGVLLILGLAVFFGLRKQVTLSIDGHSRSLTTYALTVKNLLYEEGVLLSPDDALSPPADSWLKHGSDVTLIHAVPVQIFADGKFSALYSADRSPASLLSQAGIAFFPEDKLLSNGQVIDLDEPFSGDSPSISLQVVRSISFSYTSGDESQTINSSASTLGSALWSAGLSFFVSDELQPPANTPLSLGLEVALLPSQLVTIKTQSGSVTIRTAAQTVGAALEDAHLSPQGLDYSLPTPSEPLPADGKIRLIRVVEQLLVEQSPLKFETESQPVSDLELDSQSIVQAGEYGLTAQRIRVRLEDGQEVSRKVESEWVARKPKNRIIGYGTMVVDHVATVDGVEIHYWRVLQMYATSYHPAGVGSTTASGLPLKKGVAAVDTRLVPFFTQMYVPGYGDVVAADIGGGVIGRWIDLGYSDDDYVAWHQWVTVYFLWPPPANIVWMIP